MWSETRRSARRIVKTCFWPQAAAAVAAALGLLVFASPAVLAQGGGGGGGPVFGFTTGAVGGVSISPEGVLSLARVDERGGLARLREDAQQALGDDMAAISACRKVSLRRLEAAILECQKRGEPVSDAMRLLAGLQRVEFIFVYPEAHDIVIAGPAEGWQQDAQGNIVGQQSGRAVLKLEDLIVAMRSMLAAPGTSFTCSIDPTPEGLRQFNQLMTSGRLRQMSPRALRAIEQALGPQTIRVGGIAASSHLAQVMVAADYRMKRLAMELEPAPVKGLPSYLQIASLRGSMTPRWWLAPDYETVEKDADGLAWQFAGRGVRAMAEEDFFSASGVRQASAKASPAAQRWADLMTEHYEQLALHIPVFAELQGCMDLAMVAAIIAREGLPEKAQCPLAHFLDAKALPVSEWPVPQRVDTQASAVKKGRQWLVSASGGVDMNPWQVLTSVATDEALEKVRAQSAQAAEDRWWWD